MNYLVRLNLTRRVSTLEVVDARTGAVLVTKDFEDVAESRLVALRNRLFEALAAEADSVKTETYDWRS